VDVLPGILDLAELPIPPGLDGRSPFAPPDPAASPASPSAAQHPTLLSGLKLDRHELYAARRFPWKLVWDVRGDSLRLHDLSQPNAEAQGLDSGHHAAAEQALRELRAALENSLRESAREGDAPVERVDRLPSDIEESLRALGYLDGYVEPGETVETIDEQAGATDEEQEQEQEAH
jgi:arylsulfatase A-like enzyme